MSVQKILQLPICSVPPIKRNGEWHATLTFKVIPDRLMSLQEVWKDIAEIKDDSGCRIIPDTYPGRDDMFLFEVAGMSSSDTFDMTLGCIYSGDVCCIEENELVVAGEMQIAE